MLKRTPRTKLVLGLLACAVLALTAWEAYRVYTFVAGLTTARNGLKTLEARLDLSALEADESAILGDQALLLEAGESLEFPRSFVENDPLLFVARQLPWLGRQAAGLTTLVTAADESVQTGALAMDVALAFKRYEPAPGATSLEGALDFMGGQEEAMQALRGRLDALQARQEQLPGGLVGPLDSASRDFRRSVEKLERLVAGYEQANALLPAMLGVGESRRYLVLLQNETELFPSGGLISSYGIVTFDNGRLTDFEVEYFGVLYDRWQETSGGEYVEPPTPLKQYLLREFSWALGEAGWYPDFPTTAMLAEDFVRRGGATDTEGTMAIDIQFTSALLELLGSVEVPEYGVTISSQNVAELTLQYTRNDDYVPGEPKKAFLSYLAREVLDELFGAPKQKWPEMLQLLAQMGRERHLQLNFDDPSLQQLSGVYGFDGSLRRDPDGDFLLIADTSVNSTKLNLILEPSARLRVQLRPDGSARSTLTYVVANPFAEWAAGREPGLASQLMGHGVYGSYLRTYVPAGAQLRDLRLNGEVAGAEQVDAEMGRTVFGRFFAVRPDESAVVEFVYETPQVASISEDGLHYSLYLQKQAGTKALPITVEVELPPEAELSGSTLDGEPAGSLSFDTDLRVDRQIEVSFQLR